ncbi:GntR family transcriptional regulator [Halanaerobium sp. MA284_MarDTE_T2]|uniref:GntR family transcriptional regulator n=1 Tax=Halanaerobium sp. MA284_MarDTE_T2 TaxID=2183913 RepID=UPI000DF2147A|nr:GntR family transcriptional regulator [Halanaerobium sp. MA284_MarDTE_T2]
MMEPIQQKRRSTTDIVYETLKYAIIKMDLPPGERLIEQDILEKLQVSRTPLREAIKMLEFEGFVTRNMSGGVKVSELSISELKDIYEIERVLEAKAIIDVAKKWKKGQLSRMEQIVSEIRSGLEREKRSRDDYISEQYLYRYNELNVEFHMEIVRLYGNTLFLRTLQNIEGKHLRYAHISFSKDKDRFLNASEEHVNIFNLIKKREAEKAAELAFNHKIRAEKIITANLKDFLN